MKKKYLIIGIIVVVIAVALSVWLFLRPVKLGNINHTSSEPETSTADISFSGEAGDKIRISFSSDIENGELDAMIYDSKGNVVKQLDRAKELKTFLTLDYSDTYTLRAEYTDFVGSFKVAVYQ